VGRFVHTGVREAVANCSLVQLSSVTCAVNEALAGSESERRRRGGATGGTSGLPRTPFRRSVDVAVAKRRRMSGSSARCRARRRVSDRFLHVRNYFRFCKSTSSSNPRGFLLRRISRHFGISSTFEIMHFRLSMFISGPTTEPEMRARLCCLTSSGDYGLHIWRGVCVKSSP